MVRLNLPSFDYKLRKADGKVWIFDVIRKKFVVLTPEEWVRQHFIHYMTGELKYPRSLIRIEGGLMYNQLQKRSDILLFDREGNPWMLVECKEPGFKLSQLVVEQVAAYNATHRARYITVSNGLTHLCALTDWQQGETRLLEAMPVYPEV